MRAAGGVPKFAWARSRGMTAPALWQNLPHTIAHDVFHPSPMPGRHPGRLGRTVSGPAQSPDEANVHRGTSE